MVTCAMVKLLALTLKVWGLGPPRIPDVDRERPKLRRDERSTPKPVPIRVWRWLGVVPLKGYNSRTFCAAQTR